VNPKSELPTASDFARIEGELFARIEVRHRRQVLRHRLVAAAAVLVIAGAGVAAGTVASPVQQSKSAYCYSGDSPSSRLAQLTLPISKDFDSKPGTIATAAQVDNALTLCKTVWRFGAFSRSSKSGPFPVPKLQVCLRDDLIVSIFRKPATPESAEEFCGNLGLSAP
jgi:hypothetical protein